ncbi:MAG: ORF6N domain-containing protein [Steroidobacterales bacterium]
MMKSRIGPTPAVGVDAIAKSILVLRNQNILLDRDLAALYGVTTNRLNEQVKRNHSRFPTDFMFQLSAEEAAALRSHFATSKKLTANRGGRRYLPYAFTEQGVAMLSSVLSTERAIAAIMSAIRELMNPPLRRTRGIGFTANLDE